jgi:hypothetical protein
MVFEHIATVHGPHSNADAQNLRKLLWELNPAELKWRNFLPKFIHLYTTLKAMPQLDADNKPEIGPLPAAIHHPQLALEGVSVQQQLDALQDWIARNQAEEQKIKDQYLHGGPILTFQPTDTEIFTLLQQRVKEASSYPSIHNLYAQSLENSTWFWKDLSSSSWTMTSLTTCNPPIVTRTLLRRVSIMGKSVTHHRKSTACKNNSIAVTVEARTLPENAHQLGVTPVIHARSLIQPRLAKPTSYHPPMGITAIEADAVVAGASQREPSLLLHQPQLINPRRVAT